MTTNPAIETIGVMRTRLAAYDSSSDVRSLDRLVGLLSGAMDALDGLVDGNWLQELRSAWWPLEYVNANALSDDRPTLTPDEVVSVSNSRDELLAMLIEY